MRALAITVNIDSITEYAQKYPIRLPAEDPLLMYRNPLDQFARFCQHHKAPGTLFAISRDVVGIAAEKLNALASKGFEIASHSHSHPPRLSLKQPGEILKELRHSKGVLEAATGKPVVGFRAPGYHLSPNLIRELVSLGFHYDSSVIPSASFYVARALSVFGETLSRRKSHTLLGNPKAVKAPRSPYRPSLDPYEGGGDCNIIELPLSVATPLGIPISASMMQSSPAGLKRAVLDSLKEQDTLVLGFDALDFADLEADSLPPDLAEHVPQLKIPLQERLEGMRAWVHELGQGRLSLTCSQLAAQFS